jgi:U3 small nucleolar RNA-associated protein 21
MRTWDLATGTCAEPITLSAGDRVTALMHPDTYLNKVLVAYASGAMELWNLRTRARIHRFTAFAAASSSTASSLGAALGSLAAAAGGAAITCVVQSPAVDVVGVGFADGRTLLHNLKFDQVCARVFSAFSVCFGAFVTRMTVNTHSLFTFASDFFFRPPPIFSDARCRAPI